MSKPKYYWYPIARKMIEQRVKYEEETTEQAEIFKRAISEAQKETAEMINGKERLYIVEHVLIKRDMSYIKAAGKVYYSEKTARNWTTDFVKLVGRKAGF